MEQGVARGPSDALIVGAGPVGMVAALELRRRGLSVRIVDALTEPVTYSKAQIVHARTLEVLEDMGLADALVARGLPTHAFSVWRPDSTRIARLGLDGIASKYAYLLSVSQHETESVLAGALSRAGVAIERGVKLVALAQDDAGVTATLEGPRGPEALRVPWLLGCDGSHSTVRKALGLAFEGSTYEQRIIQADLRIDWPVARAPDEVHAFLGPNGMIGAFPLPGENRYRLMTPLRADEKMEPTLETFQALLDTRGPPGSRASDPRWMVDFRFHCRMVPEYRVGRVFLAGDAAHVHSPAGGQGLNMGIQDAYNLTWKLALVHRGEGRPVLLDSYHAERHPVAAATLRGTDRVTRAGLTMLSLQNPLAAELRNDMMSFVTGLEVVRERAGRTASMLDVAYEASPILAQDRPSVLSAHVVSDRVTEQPSLRDWLDFGGGPTPGARALDCVLPPAEHGAERLFELLYGGRHTLLLFDGAAPTTDGYHRLEAIARAVTERHGAQVRVCVVVPTEAPPSALSREGWAGVVVLDPDGELHRTYGARSECLYLVRPDGYVGYRCQPADGAHLSRYLEGIFRESSSP